MPNTSTRPLWKSARREEKGMSHNLFQTTKAATWTSVLQGFAVPLQMDVAWLAWPQLGHIARGPAACRGKQPLRPWLPKTLGPLGIAFISHQLRGGDFPSLSSAEAKFPKKKSGAERCAYLPPGTWRRVRRLRNGREDRKDLPNSILKSWK